MKLQNGGCVLPVNTFGSNSNFTRDLGPANNMNEYRKTSNYVMFTVVAGYDKVFLDNLIKTISKAYDRRVGLVVHFKQNIVTFTQ